MEDVLTVDIELQSAPLLFHLVHFLVHEGPHGDLVLQVQKIRHLDPAVDDNLLLGCMLVNNQHHEHAKEEESEIIGDVHAQYDVVHFVSLFMIVLIIALLYLD